MNLKQLVQYIVLSAFISCSPAGNSEMSVELEEQELKFQFSQLTLSHGIPGLELLVGEEEELLEWYPREPANVVKSERNTPMGAAHDLSMSWLHSDGYELIWTLCKLESAPGFTLRSSVINHSDRPVRLRNFILCKTPQDGLVCTGNPASWWLNPAMTLSRQAGNLAQVLPSRLRLKEQNVYGYDQYGEEDPRNSDGHWRFHEEVITLYSDTDRKGVAMGAIGPGVSHVDFNCRVDSGQVLLEIVSRMDEILLDPGEQRVSEEVLVLAKPYREALTDLFSWMAETHEARKKRDPVFGWCSWYDRFTHIDQDHLFRISKVIGQQREWIPLEVVQIDHGWAGPFGDWSENQKFGLGMGAQAEAITRAGAMPGIWMSPVVSEVEKPEDWFQNSGSTFLDPTHPEVEAFILSSVSEKKEEGFRYFKFDYNTLEKFRPYNPKMTNFELMHHLFSLYRQAIGEDCYMLGCGAPPRPVVGIVDAHRTGWDALARWKSFPLADDGLPTLQTDIFDGIFNLAASSSMNNILYHNDPDVTYMLPRAESHIWQGSEGSFDPDIHGLKLAGLQTFHSYVGLLGGMALVSEPLDEARYRKPEAIRMLEILNPPAPDKGWSMNGDVDPLGRQFGFVAEREWGDFASLVLWNKEDSSSDLQLDSYALSSLGEKYHIWSFWDEKYLGIGDASMIFQKVAPHGCKLLRLTPPAEQDVPLLVGSNLHIAMGSAEVSRIECSVDGMRIKLSDAGARKGKLYIHSSKTLELTTSKGCDATLRSEADQIFIVEISGRSRTEENLIELTVSQ